MAVTVTSLTEKRKAGARAETAPQGTSRVYLIGTMRAVDHAGNDVLPARRKTQAVLAYLCLAQGSRLQRSRVAGLVWDRSGEEQARDSLRHALTDLQRAGWKLERDNSTVRLDTAGCWIDALETPDRSDLLLDSLYGTSAAFDQWLIAERIRYENRWQTILETDLDKLVARGAAAELQAAAARRVLNFIPTHETAVRRLMAAFLEMNDPAQAIREFERFRAVMQTNLGLPPSEKTVSLYENIRLAPRRRTHSLAPAVARANTFPASSGEAPATPLPQDSPVLSRSLSPDPRLQPAIAVLPFRNLSSQSGLIAEGLTEDLVEGFSRVPSLFVVSRLSAAVFGNQVRPAQEIGAALGVHYLLSGSVRASGERLRLSAELTDVRSGMALWIARLDEPIGDLLDLQDRLAASVVGSVAPHVRSAELRRLRRKRREDYDAYDLFLRGQEAMHNPEREHFETAPRLFAAALEREPEYAAALAWLAHWHVLRIGQGWSRDPSIDTVQANEFATRAVASDPTEPLAFAVQGHIAAYLHRDFELATEHFATALRVCPNNARAWLWSAYADAWANRGSTAIEKIDRAMALSPYDPLVCVYSAGASLAYMAAGQYARATEFALRCRRENKGYTAAYKLLVCSLMLAGEEAEARAVAHQLLGLEPHFTIERFRRSSPASTGLLGELYCESFARAGVPVSD
ncbi:MAG: hypothetical protein JO001_29450 [Alphaproteobacteria bacterium]|nr:hypothetical protein [Alphaproteobacteria bacterium]